MNNNTVDRINQYLFGEMSKEEISLFEKEMENNSKLKSNVFLQQEIILSVRERYVKEQVIKIGKEVYTQERRRRTFAMRISSIAVAACLVLGVFVHFDTQSDYRQYGLGIELAISRGGGYSDKAAVAINEGHYDEALSLIAEGEAQPFVCDDTNPEIVEAERDEYQREQDELQWYKTVAYMRMGKYIKAKKLLKQITLSDSEYKDEAQAALDALQ